MVHRSIVLLLLLASSASAGSQSRVFMSAAGEHLDAATSGNTVLYMDPGSTVVVHVWSENLAWGAIPLSGYQLMFDWFATPAAGATGIVQYKGSSSIVEWMCLAETQHWRPNYDMGGPHGDCTLDGHINLHDMFHSILAFNGNTDCICVPGEGLSTSCASTTDCCDVDADGIRDHPCFRCSCGPDGMCIYSQRTFQADITGVTQNCLLDGLPNLHDYNSAMFAFGQSGAQATVGRVHDFPFSFPLVRPREDPPEISAFPAFGMVYGWGSVSSTSTHPASPLELLGQFEVTASNDAAGSHVLSFLPEGSPIGGGTFFVSYEHVPNTISPYPIDQYQNLTIVVRSCGDGACHPGEDEATCSADCDCSFAAACCDVNENGIRDDACQWCACDATCAPLTTVLGDVGGAFGACVPDGSANVHDRNAVLTCFAGVNVCPRINVDVGGSFGDCAPDGFCNVHDAVHVVTQFAGTSSCACGPMPEGGQAAAVSGRTAMRIDVDPPVARAGDVVAVRVSTTSAIPLQAYQLEVAATAAATLIGVEIEPDQHPPFSSVDTAYQAVNLATGQMLRGALSPDHGRKHAGYLATYFYRVSRSARDAIRFDARIDAANGDQSFLVGPGATRIEIAGATPATVRIIGH